MKGKSLIPIICVLAYASCNNSIFSNIDSYPAFNEITFETISSDYADLYCSLSSQGNYEIEELGFVMSTEPDAATPGSAFPATIGRGEFYLTLVGLTPNTTYYVCAYAKLTNGKYRVGQEYQFTTLKKGDYSSAKVECSNYKLELVLLSCLRAGNRVTIEATLLNKSISPDNSFFTREIGKSNTAGMTHVEDNLFTDYAWTSLMVYLNNASGHNLPSTPLPIGSTKRLTLTIDGVPHSAQTISVYIAAEFYYTTPTEYCYLTFENVPIY